ncbi:MAG: type II toxin-antitoxin system HicA family toxin [Gemmatimonadetes bacterium]|nr:type II toxin-antitoxin system HicA family toxin [Gemmatimonadota bacterium]
MDSQAVLRRLRADGWEIDRIRGSHCQLKHPEKRGLVTVPHPRRDLPAGTLRSIERQSGLRLR